MFFITRLFVSGIPIILLLTACGGGAGGGGGGGGTEMTNIGLGAQASQVTNIISDGLNVQTNREQNIEVDVPDENSLIAAMGEDGRLLYLGLLEAGAQQIALDELSTAKALVASYPPLIESYLENPELFDSIFDQMASLDEFLTYIEDNPEWSDSSQQFTDLFLVSLDEFLALYTPTPRPSFSNQSALLKVGAETRTAAKVIADDLLGQSGSQITIGGVDLELTTDYFSDSNAVVTVEATNDTSRWVTLVIEDANNVLLVKDLVKPDGKPISYKLDARTFSEDGGTIYIVGPSLDIDSQVLISFDPTNGWYLDAALPTLVDQAVKLASFIPGLGLAGCIDANELLLRGRALPEIKIFVNEGRYQEVLLKLIELMLNADVYGDCVGEIAEEIFFETIGEFFLKQYNIYFEAAYEFAPGLASLALYPALQSASLDNVGTAFIAFDEAMMTSELGYDGECPSPVIGKDVVCRSFEFDEPAPFEVQFIIECFTPDLTLTDCVSAAILPGNSAGLAIVLNSTLINGRRYVLYTASYADEGEYAGTVTTEDMYGAESIHEFRIQINGRPETVFGDYTVCIVGNSCFPLTISEGTPGDGIAYVTYASHLNWQGTPVALDDQDTFLSASAGPTLLIQRFMCEDGVLQDVNIVWTSELSIDLAGGSNGTQSEFYDYGGCVPNSSNITPVYVQIP